MSSCDADLFIAVFAIRFFGEDEQDAECEAGGVDFEEPAQVNK